MNDLKSAQSPGPGLYSVNLDMGKEMNQAKTMSGGAVMKVAKRTAQDDFPGPDHYRNFPEASIPGFVLHPPTVKTDKKDDKNKKAERGVGPEKYFPMNPNHRHSDFLNGQSFSNAMRGDPIEDKNAANVGPGKYDIKSNFDINDKTAKFHMGIKTQGFAGKNMDQPGPGEYETDVIPIHHSHVAHIIGTSARSDLGIGKAKNYPGPGNYEAPIDSSMDPRIRIAGTFGTDKKDTIIKKTFAPGPGSYDAPASIGLMPQYLRTEENRAIKEAQEAALRARLEI